MTDLLWMVGLMFGASFVVVILMFVWETLKPEDQEDPWTT